MKWLQIHWTFCCLCFTLGAGFKGPRIPMWCPYHVWTSLPLTGSSFTWAKNFTPDKWHLIETPYFFVKLVTRISDQLTVYLFHFISTSPLLAIDADISLAFSVVFCDGFWFLASLRANLGWKAGYNNNWFKNNPDKARAAHLSTCSRPRSECYGSQGIWIWIARIQTQHSKFSL